jgi:hypothetical protein
MSTKSDFSEHEWQELLKAPVLAGTYIIIADMSVTAMPREMKGLFKAIQSQPAPPDAQELVTAMAADIRAKSERKEELEPANVEKGEDTGPQLLAEIEQSLAVLDQKGDPGEKAAFAGWLLGVAQATAEAGREGGFLGMGSVRVSEQEQAALQQLKETLGLA